MTDQSSAHNTPEPAVEYTGPHPPVDRRGFAKAVAAIGIGAVLILTPLVSGVLFFLDPLIRRIKGSGDADFIPVDTTVDSLPDSGAPVRVTIYADKVDAWNKFVNQPIGSVYLRKNDAGEVKAYNVLCPHLGCTVDYRPTKSDFFCPCHTSSFNLDGEKTNVIPPRGLDELEVRIDGNNIAVKYQEFLATKKEKIPV